MFHSFPLKRSFILETYLIQVKSWGEYYLMESSIFQLTSHPAWVLHKTFTFGIILRLNTFSAWSKIFMGCLGIVKSDRTSGWLVSITALGSNKHFLNWESETHEIYYVLQLDYEAIPNDMWWVQSFLTLYMARCTCNRYKLATSLPLLPVTTSNMLQDLLGA